MSRTRRHKLTGAKAVSHSCENHGSCEWCRRNRTYNELRDKEKASYDEKEFANLNVKCFEKPTEEWAIFIFTNRNKRNKKMHNYDIVVGPVADDGVIASIRLYETKVIDLAEFVKRLEYAHPNIQYAFCTERAIALLQKI